MCTGIKTCWALGHACASLQSIDNNVNNWLILKNHSKNSWCKNGCMDAFILQYPIDNYTSSPSS